VRDHVFTVGLTVGCLVLAVWLDARLGESRPAGYIRRIGHSVVAFLVLEGSTGVLYYAKAHGLGAPGIMLGVFLLFLPALVYALLTGLWLIRTLADVARLARH
jgi:hypothetical protein